MNDNPNWKPLLDAVPNDLHPLIKPHLEAWDKGVQERFKQIHDQYDPYKQFVENKVDPRHIGQGLDILGQISDNPAAFVKKVDEVYNLSLIGPQVAPESAPQTGGDNEYDEFDFGDNVDITKHPAFKQIAAALESVQKQVETQTQTQQEQQELEDFEAYLDELNDKYKDQGGINRELVTAYMSQGLDGDTAVKAYQDQITAALAASQGLVDSVTDQNNPQGQGAVPNGVANPPNVMGSQGTAGGGLPDTTVVPGKWTDTQTTAAVMEMLRTASEPNQ